MKNLLFVLLGSLLHLSGYSTIAKEEKESTYIATCYGHKNCYACKNCKYCAHCNSGGGSCGVCSSSASLPIKVPQKVATEKSRGNTTSSSSSQCQGITKRGQRCKRMVKGGGYCWQHS